MDFPPSSNTVYPLVARESAHLDCLLRGADESGFTALPARNFNGPRLPIGGGEGNHLCFRR